MENKKSSGKGLLIIGWIIIIVFIMWIFFGDFNSSKEQSKECSSCGKTFTNNDDVHSIIMTSMCENCYDDYKYIQDLKEDVKKYNERYGN